MRAARSTAVRRMLRVSYRLILEQDRPVGRDSLLSYLCERQALGKCGHQGPVGVSLTCGPSSGRLMSLSTLTQAVSHDPQDQRISIINVRP